MMGLMVLMFFAVYLLVSVFVTRKAAGWAKANNRKPWLWGGVAAFMMYNLVFWDLIPTLIVHKHYCDTEAGLTIYKTPEQWKAENPDLTAEDLKPLGNKDTLYGFPVKPLRSNSKKWATAINQRIYLDGTTEWYISNLVPIHRDIDFIADNKDDAKLAQIVTFGSGYGNPLDWRHLKIWLQNGKCHASNVDEWEKYGYKKFIRQIVELGE